MCNCLYCYRPLTKGEKDMHKACIKKFFGTTTLPALDYTTEQLDRLPLQIIRDQTSLTRVQPKLSLHLAEHEGSKRGTVVRTDDSEHDVSRLRDGGECHESLELALSDGHEVGYGDG